MLSSVPPPAGVKKADWDLLLMEVEDYREINETPMAEANEAAQRVADMCVGLLLTGFRPYSTEGEAAR